MSSKHTTIPILLTGCVCASVLFVVSKKPKTVVSELPHAESFDAYLRVPRDMELCFDSLLAWQSGDTNQFHRILHEKEYDTHLRDAVQRAIRQGKEGEVLRFINLVLDHWMITESCHSRSYEWPDREADQEAWEFLSRIYVNRQQHPYSTGDADDDATLNRILEKTR